MSFSRHFSLLLLASVTVAHSAPVSAERYELKTRSSCSLDPATRPPFWPIGWVKRAVNANQGQAPVVVAKPVLEEKNFVMTSILLGTPSLAVINGRSYSEGEFIRFPKSSGGAGMRVLVRQIHDGVVQLQAADQVISIKLRQQELGLKKFEEELLNDSR
ncbi:MAG: hypothetical protein JWL59_1635 [Chthoniobacteraceae bacterium]|nr:hypothetical protein [Chthoniobacteraceae bacterium]